MSRTDDIISELEGKLSETQEEMRTRLHEFAATVPHSEQFEEFALERLYRGGILDKVKP